MNEWKKYSLEDLAFYYNGKAFKPSDWKKDGVKIIRIEQLNNPEGFYDFYQGEFPDTNKIENGDLIFSWSATLKVLIWKHGDAVLNQHLFKVVPKQFVDKHFLFFLLDQNMEKIGDTSHGSTMKHIKRGELEKFFVFAPDKTIQQQIAKILSTADAVIEKTQAAIDKYKAIKQGMLHDLFTRGIDISTGKLRPKYEDAPELYKESKLGMIPKEWEEKPLEDIAVIHNGIDYKRNPTGQEIPIYGTGGIMGFTSISLNNGPAVLTGRKGSINRPIYVEGEFWNVDTIFCLKPKDKINTKWLYYNILLTDMNKYNEATGVPSIASKTLYKLNFCYYDIVEQNKIIEFITPIENTLQSEESSLLKLKQLKTGLMGDLLSGKKRVTVKEED